MNLQYISDASGKHTAIVIPIEEWNKITAKYQDLKDLEKAEPSEKKRLSEKYAGKLPSQIADELQAYVTQSRAEWNNRSI